VATLNLQTVARLAALENGKAVPVATHLQISIQPEPLILCCMAMAGEATTVHIAACGRFGQPTEYMSVPDPRSRDDQYDLLTWIAFRVEQYYNECREVRAFPQIWVASDGAIKHLDLLANRLRNHRDNPRVKRLGELLAYVTERFPIDGQQALVSATSALRLHYATGQQPAEDEHLGTILTWIDPPAGINVLAAVAMAEQNPMGAKTDPEFDRLILEPRVRSFNTAKRASASAVQLARRAQIIHNALLPVVSRIFEATQTALTILQTRWPQRLPGMDELQRYEAEEFESFMQSRDNGYFVPLRDRPKAAAFKLTERELARKNFEAALRAGDRVALANAGLAGHVLNGTVENPRVVRIGSRNFTYSFDLISEQKTLRVRPRDELHLIRDPRQIVAVRSVQRQRRITRLELEIVKGMRAVGLPSAGSTVVYIPSVPEWEVLMRTRAQMRERLANPPWTHQSENLPPASPSPMARPVDVLASVEAFR
jgi:hypothetical protein